MMLVTMGLEICLDVAPSVVGCMCPLVAVLRDGGGVGAAQIHYHGTSTPKTSTCSCY